MTDIPGDSSTTVTSSVGGTVNDELETVGDHDWIAITLTAGQHVTILVNGVTLADPYLYVRDNSGVILFESDDITAGVNHDSRVAFNPGYSGTYYIDVGAFHDAGTGTYQVSVQPYTPPGPGTIDQIAHELTTDFWLGETHHFDVSQGGTITVNIATLTLAEQSLARAALQQWSDIIGVGFQEVTGPAQITFDHSEAPGGPIAATDADWANGITTSAYIQISSSWVDAYGAGLDSYSFQTYLHEIGHALGLGHSGDYNVSARYPYDALFQNDGWPVSVMSYFDQSQNSYYGYSPQFVLTPMAADIVAMQSLYGLSATTRTGDTTYGFNSTAGGIYSADVYPDAAYAIFDNGGIDTLDFSGGLFSQRINLTAETFSDVNGHNLNLYIARGVAIENAIGGSGDDTIIQNAANNFLNGGAGIDTVSYDAATAGIGLDLNIAAAQNTGGAGIDTVTNFEHVIGSAFADTLIASATTWSLTGGAGDDLLVAGPTVPPGSLGMYGGDGNDVLMLGGGEEWLDGGAGFNTVDCSNATTGVLLTTNGHAGASAVTLQNIQKIVGSSFADTLYAFGTGIVLVGAAGDDTLISLFGGSSLTGGTGNDTYQLSGDLSDQIIENDGEGIDTVIARGTYALGASLENLTLVELHSADPFAGASVPPPNQPEDWNGTGNELGNVIIGNQGSNALVGLGGADMLRGGAGPDVLSGGAGNDTFKDSAASLNGDTITDFSRGDRIVITDAALTGFTYQLFGTQLVFAGGSVTLSNLHYASIYASAAPEGGVQITFSSPPIVLSAGAPVAIAGLTTASFQSAEIVEIKASSGDRFGQSTDSFLDHGGGWFTGVDSNHVNAWHGVPPTDIIALF